MTDPHAFHHISLGDLLMLVLALRVAWYAGKALRPVRRLRLFHLARLTIRLRNSAEIPDGSMIDVDGILARVVKHRWPGLIVVRLTGLPTLGAIFGKPS